MAFIEELGEWVGENPEDADAVTINLTTGREFTVRGIYEQLVAAEEEDVEIVDKEVLEVVDNIQKWLEGV